MSLFGDVIKIGSLGLIDTDKKAPSAPKLPAAPDFKNSYYYDSDGNLSGSITKDAEGNIVYKPKALTAGEQVEKKVIEDTRKTLLQRLYNTPEEYTRAATEEAGAYAKEAGRVAQEGFEKDVNRIGEVSNTRGLVGSKAYADIIKGREETQAQTQATIGNQATAMRQGLIDQKKAGDYGLYSLYDNALGQYNQNAMQGLQATQGLSGQINQFNQQNWATGMNAQIANYQNQLKEYEANDPWRNYVTPIIQTVATLKSSDRRLKKDIRPEFKVGDVQFYSFEYIPVEDFPGLIPPAGRHIGVMADEVKHLGVVVENALGTKYDMVDYEALRRHLKMEMS